MRFINWSVGLCALILATPALAKVQTVQPQQWSCAQSDARGRGLVTALQFKFSEGGKFDGSITLVGDAAGRPTRPFQLQSIPSSVQSPLNDTIMIFGYADSTDNYHVNLHLVLLVNRMSADGGPVAEVVTELDSGMGTVKDSLPCTVTLGVK